MEAKDDPADIVSEIRTTVAAAADDDDLPVTAVHCLHCGSCMKLCPVRAVIKR